MNTTGTAATAQISVQIDSVGASPTVAEEKRLCDFFDCPVLFISHDPAPRSNQRVSAQGDAFGAENDK